MKSLTSNQNDRSVRNRYRLSARKLFVAEITIKLLVNGILIAAGISTLLKLWPEHFSQSSKLREIRLTVNQTQTRVDQARSNFNSNFAPKRTQKVVEEQTILMQPGRVPVFWLNENSTSGN